MPALLLLKPYSCSQMPDFTPASAQSPGRSQPPSLKDLDGILGDLHMTMQPASPKASLAPKPPSPLGAVLTLSSKVHIQTQASKQDRILAWMQADQQPHDNFGGLRKEPDDWRSHASSAELLEGMPDDLVLRSASMPEEQGDPWVSGGSGCEEE